MGNGFGDLPGASNAPYFSQEIFHVKRPKLSEQNGVITPVSLGVTPVVP